MSIALSLILAVIKVLRSKELKTVGLVIGVSVPVGGPAITHLFQNYTETLWNMKCILSPRYPRIILTICYKLDPWNKIPVHHQPVCVTFTLHLAFQNKSKAQSHLCDRNKNEYLHGNFLQDANLIRENPCDTWLVFDVDMVYLNKSNIWITGGYLEPLVRKGIKKSMRILLQNDALWPD